MDDSHTTLAAQIEALAERATEGDWFVQTNPVLAIVAREENPVIAEITCVSEHDAGEEFANAELICLLKSNLPAIVTALRQAEAAPGVALHDETLAEALCNNTEARRIAEQLEASSYADSAPHVQEYWQALARQHGAREDGWQPIESAPTNKAVQVFIPGAEYYGNGGVYAAMLVDMGTGRRWMTFGWAIGRDCSPEAQPMAWRYLPVAPATHVGEAV